eukprot:gene46344-59545_t
MLARIKGRIIHRDLDQISPLAVPIMLDIGKEAVPGEADESLLAEAADDLIAEALRAAEIHGNTIVAGCQLSLLSQGALWWPAERTLVVADLHLEKGSRMAMRGQFVPPYDTGLTLSLIEALTAALDPARVISLGAAFDDVAGAD